MKTCPQCGKTYPDSEAFCETDGAQLSAGQAWQPRGTHAIEAASSGAIECPVCGGKAEPGETICNFCGARLSEPAGGTRVAEAPPHLDSAQKQFEGEPPPEERAPRRLFGTIGYAIAGVVALAAGAGLALYISTRQQPARVAEAPSAAATTVAPSVAAGPLAVLASNIGLQVTGESASAPQRDQTAARKVFDDKQSALLDLYKRTLSTDALVKDGMIARMRVAPDGSIAQGEVRVSTAMNPSLDADVVKEMMGWTFAPFSGSEVEVDYPLIFAHDSAEQAEIESALNDKVAHLSPAEPSEYASAPAPATSPGAVAAGTPASVTSPAVAVTPPTPAVAVATTPEAAPSGAATRAAHRRRRRLASLATPKPTLLKLVQNRLAGNRKFSRVKAYTDAGTVTLYGKVFNDDAKSAAERAVRGIDGVVAVNDTLTTDTADWADRENRIRQELQNSGLSKVGVKVIGHDAYLDGEVSTDQEKQRAVTVAENAAPVVVRSNLIRVVPRGMFGF